MKKLVFLLVALASCLPLGAQNVNAEYDRNSLTVIAIHHNDRYDAVTDAYLKRVFPGGEKFDNNMVATYFLDAPYSRFEERENVDTKSSMKSHLSDIDALLKKEHVPQQIIGKWFNRTQNGMMNLNLINNRADYNATDQTYNIASAQALGQYLLHGDGVKLLDNSYILVIDHTLPVRSETRDQDTGKLTRITWTTRAIGYLYKLQFGDIQRQAVYDQWIYLSDDDETRKAKNKAWDKIQFPYILRGFDMALSSGSIDPQKTTDETPAINAAVEGCAHALISSFEKSLDAWKVKTTIYKTQPLRSKVGTKEGLKNMSRFEVREYMLDDNGNVETKRKGVVRATDIAENTRAPRGYSPMSEFYQIAGTHLEPGMLLVQKPSSNLEVKALYYSGAAKGYGAEIDFLMGMSTGGSCSHIRLGGTYYSYPKGLTGTEYKLGENITAIAVRMGYGYGLRPIRQVEFIPTAYLLADFLDSKVTENEQKNSAFTKAGWGIEAGLDANITVFYPVKLNVGAYYSAPLVGGKLWQAYRDVLKDVGQNRMGFTWRAGLVLEF